MADLRFASGGVDGEEIVNRTIRGQNRTIIGRFQLACDFTCDFTCDLVTEF
jgi:hypothetical protein